MIIYKITNLINSKVYIGLTTTSLSYRWSRHLIESRNTKNTKHLYKSIRKYGVENFTIEEIDNTNELEKLGELERYYINKFDSTNPKKGYNLTSGGERNQYDGNPSSKLKINDIIFIRTLYDECELTCNECRLKYYPQMSYSGFQKIWEGYTWKGIKDEVYTKENIDFHSHQTALKGEKNGNAKYTDEEVFQIRLYYVNHTLKETYNRFNKYGESIKNSFRNYIDCGYKHIPIYKKIDKQWYLNGKAIQIEDYNPVSTISASGE